ncbi:MAG: ABC transporter ATP-binding protein [Beijerinckiaceae bacterium]
MLPRAEIMTYLALANLAKRYGATVAVDHVTLDVDRGESVALLGPSGCGKTTTLRMLAGLIAPDDGRITVEGTDITHQPAHKRNMGYVFQSYALFPHLTVARNIAFGLEERGIARADIERRVANILSLVRLNGLENRKPRELSGGQQQRVALARALVIEPSVLLLDESLSNLDAKLRDAMRHEIRDIQRKLSITTLFVTHDQVEALTMCDRIAVMERGRIAQVGTPVEIYERPTSRFVATFVGRANALPVTRDRNGYIHVLGARLPSNSTPTGDMDAFVRPQRIKLVSASESVGPKWMSVPCTVKRVVFVGEHLEILVAHDSAAFTIEVPSGQTPPSEGAALQAVWHATDTLLFPRETE